MLGGCVSLVSITYVFICYFNRGWRRYPNRLLCWQSLAHLTTALGVTISAVHDGISTGWGTSKSNCTVFNGEFNPLVLQFGYFSAEVWGKRFDS